MCYTEAKRNTKEESSCYFLHAVWAFCMDVSDASAEKI